MGPLLETKFHVPRRRPNHVPRLRESLGWSADSALTLVSAPAGFGKTTLLADWMQGASLEHHAVWVTLDDRDNDPPLFWTYVVTALHRAAPDVGGDALSMLSSSPGSIDAVVASLVNDLDAVADGVALVLDDYHTIDTAEIHQDVAYMIEHLPPTAHLLIGTRFDPPLPLARLRARGEMVEIRAADLRFTHDEVATYLDGMRLGLGSSDVAALAERTEGWIAALQLAALSMRNRDDASGFIANFAGDDRYVLDYLVGEVLQRQPADVRRFLLQTSILRRMNGALCDAVTCQDDGKGSLAYLEHANLFVVPLDDRREWYRYHHLFAEMLRAHLRDEHHDQTRGLHSRASGWYEQQGDRAEAIHHALAGGDFERAADLIELAANPLRQSRQEATLRRWLEALPEEVFRNRPVLSIVMVGALMASGEFEGVEPLLAGAERWLEPPAGPDPDDDDSPSEPVVVDEIEFRRLPSQIAVYRSAQARILGDHVGTIGHALRAKELATDDDHLGRGSASGLLGLAHWSLGDLDGAHAHYSDAAASLGQAGHLTDVLGCTLALGDIRVSQGRLHDALSTYHHGLALAGREDAAVRGAADLHVGMAELLLEHNDLAGALDHLLASASLGEQAHLPQQPYRWRVAMARIRRSEGNLSESVELLDDAQRVYNGDFSPHVRPIAALRARVRLAQGELDDALRWANERELSIDDELGYLREFEHLTFVRVLLAQHAAQEADGPPADVIRFLDRLLIAAENGKRAGSVIEILTLQVLAHQAMGDDAQALATLERALTLAQPEGYTRVFLDVGTDLARLLRTAAWQAGHDGHARRVLAAFSSAPVHAHIQNGSNGSNGSKRPNGLVEPLSERELDVLRLLRSQLNGPDIALQLHVSVNTLRTHTKHIYAKLGANSRRAAIARAEELGL